MTEITLDALDTIIKHIKPYHIIGIDGDAASGKTTFAKPYEKDSLVVHMDHFYLPFDKRKDMPGGMIDFDKLINDVIIPFKMKQPIKYTWYDPHKDVVKEVISLDYKPTLIIEGAYSLHPIVSSYIDLSVLFKIEKSLQKKRIINRSSIKTYEAFKEKWIPLEQAYQSKTEIESRIDYKILIHI